MPGKVLAFPLRVKVGHAYLRRDGEVITIDQYKSGEPFPYIDSKHGNGYQADGTHAPNRHRPAMTNPLTGKFQAEYTELEEWNLIKELT